MLTAILRFFKKKFSKRRTKKRSRRFLSVRRKNSRPKHGSRARRNGKRARLRTARAAHRFRKTRRPRKTRRVRAKARPVKRRKVAAVSTSLVGEVTHYFPKVNAAVVKCKKSISIGDPILIRGGATDFRQTVGSLQIDRIPIEKAKAGQEVGLEVGRQVRVGDKVFLLKGE